MSVCLGLEWSTKRCSVAVKREGSVIEHFRMMDRFHAPDALALLSQTFEDSGCSEKEVTEIRVGRGPGNYTGIRQSMAYAIGLGCSASVPIRAVNSGTVLFSGLKDAPLSAWVLGDARRGMWWGAQFPAPAPEWMVQSPELWKQQLSEQRIYSSEAERVQGVPVIQMFPSAKQLFLLPESVLNERLTPKYVHPAV